MSSKQKPAVAVNSDVCLKMIVCLFSLPVASFPALHLQWVYIIVGY